MRENVLTKVHDVSLVDIDEELEGVAEDEHQDDANQHRRDVKVPGNKFENSKNKNKNTYYNMRQCSFVCPSKIFHYFMWESAQKCIFCHIKK